MTVSTTTNSIQYTGNGVTTVFPIPYVFYDDSDLVVTTTVVATGVSTVLTLSDYTVTGGEGATGSITTNTAVAVGTRITIERNLPYTQGDDFLEGNVVQAEVIEEAFDRNVILAQQLSADVALSLKFPATDPSGLTTDIPSSVDRASKLLGFDASGNVTVLSDSASSAAAAAASAAAAAASAASIALPLAIASGGTGQTSKTNAFDALSPGTTKGDIIVYNGSDNVRLPVGTDTYALVADSTQATGLKYSAVSSFPTSSFTNKIFYGLTLSNNAVDATNDIDIAAGSCVSDDGTTVMNLTAITKRLDAAWAVGTGNGGLDTGAIANGTYWLWVINRTDTNVTDVLFSASATAPTMPTSYTKKKLIGAILRESAAIVLFDQAGMKFMRRTPSVDVDAQNPGTSAVTRTLKVPTGLAVLADITVAIFPGTNNVSGYVSSLVSSDLASQGALTSPLTLPATTSADAGWSFSPYQVLTNTAGQVRSRISASGANDRLGITTYGWTLFGI